MSKRATLKDGKKTQQSSKATPPAENTIRCPGCGRPTIVGMHPGVVISNLSYQCPCGKATTVSARG